jgi:endonuclease I
MKSINKPFYGFFIATLIAITLNVGIHKETTQIKGWDEPQTSDYGTYYDGIGEHLTGSALKSALNSLISATPLYRSYDWERFEETCELIGTTDQILTLYARSNLTKVTDRNNVIGGYNREHVYPQSKMSSPATEDNHVIFLEDTRVNTVRSNNRFRDLGKTGTQVVDTLGNLTNNYSSDGYFEPNDDAKGEVARVTMYAEVMYGYTIEDNIYDIATALRWSLEYAPTSREYYRNNVVHTNQNNRNPFIDKPEYACRIWGNTNSETQSICATTTPLPRLEMAPQSTRVFIDETYTLNVFNHGGLSSNSATWSSSNPSVATVSGGEITPVSVGRTTITATSTVNPSITATSYVFIADTSPIVANTPGSIAYVFNSFSWGATNEGEPANWYNGARGLAYNNGIQVSTGYSGAYGNSPDYFVDITKVTVYYRTNTSSGVGTISTYGVNSFSAGGQTGTKIGEKPVTVTAGQGLLTRSLEFDYTGGSQLDGYMQIYVKCTTNSIYIQGVVIEVYYDPPSVEYAQHFLDTTGPECSVSNVQESTWLALMEKYLELPDEVKDDFYDNGPDSPIIEDAIARYTHIVNKYGYTNFIVNSDGNPLFTGPTIFTVPNDEQAKYILILYGALLLTATGIIYYRSRKKYFIH